MNIICLVPSLDLGQNNLYLKLRTLLGDAVERDLTPRTKFIKTKTVSISFITCRQYTEQISGVMVDMAIIADKNATQEWCDYLKQKVLGTNGIILTLI